METMHFHTVHTKCFEDNFVSHSGDPNEQFDTHEKFLGVQSNLNWMPGILDSSQNFVSVQYLKIGLWKLTKFCILLK